MRFARPILTGILAVCTAAMSVGAQGLDVADARADFDVLRHALEEAHGALYRWTPKRELDAKFDAARASLRDGMTQGEFAYALSGMIAEIGDGHSRLEFDDATMAAMAKARLFPLRIALEGDRAIVAANETPNDTTFRPGDEITGINGRPMRDIVAALLPIISRDGFIETGRRTRLGGRNFSGTYWLYIERRESFTVTGADPAGHVKTATLVGVIESSFGKNGNPVNDAIRAGQSALGLPSENISVRFMRDSQVGVLRIRSFGGDRFEAELDSVMHLAISHRVRGMVLDLRGNGGGVDMYGAHLVSEFAHAPFRYFDHIHLESIAPSFATWKPTTFTDVKAATIADPHGGFLATTTLHPGIAEQQPAQQPFTGPLVIMMDGGTFSTAADVTATLQGMKRATFVGEESGGAAEGNTSGLNALVVLPKSGLKLKVQMFGYVNAVHPAVHGRGTLPDIEMPTRVADIIAGRDPALDRALSIAAAP